MTRAVVKRNLGPFVLPPGGDEFWSKRARDMAQVLITFGKYDRKELIEWLINNVTLKGKRVQERHVLEAADELYKRNRNPVKRNLVKRSPEHKYSVCICGHFRWQHNDVCKAKGCSCTKFTKPKHIDFLEELKSRKPMRMNPKSLKPRNRNSRVIKETAGLGMALIASEHFFSSMLTSPMTTKKFFAGDPEGTADTIKALKLAVGLSIVSGIVLSWVSKSWTPLVTTGLVSGFYWWEYNKALRGEI